MKIIQKKENWKKNIIEADVIFNVNPWIKFIKYLLNRK